MGHTIDVWTAKVSSLVRDEAGVDLRSDQIETVGLRPAINRFSTDRPRTSYVDVVGAGSSYFDVPTGWVPGFSRLATVEFPARQNPPQYLDDQSWEMVRKPGDVATEQVLLRWRAPTSSQHVVFGFTGPWPYPDNATGDQIDDVAFEAVAALATSYCCVSLSGEASRSRIPAMANEITPETSRAASLLTAAQMYAGVYNAYLGLAEDGKSSSAAPAFGRVDFDPSYFSVFHGGRT